MGILFVTIKRKDTQIMKKLASLILTAALGISALTTLTRPICYADEPAPAPEITTAPTEGPGGTPVEPVFPDDAPDYEDVFN